MNQQPDKLFREKLENHHKPVSAQVWNRIETRLNKKNNKGIWLRVAAALILLVVAAILLWPKRSAVNQPELLTEKSPVKTEVPKKEIAPSEKQNIAPEIKPEIKRDRASAKKRIPEKIKAPVEAPTVNEEVVPEVIITEADAETTQLPTITDVENHRAEISETVIANLPEETSVEDAGVTIVYSSEEVNNKYLDKRSLAEATSKDKKPSTLRKLLDKAYDLKNNQDAFGDLRQKKNEILALNFKSEKQRSQNK
jgi:hypothetical protein